MALPASGEISLLQIRNEFRQGPTTPIYLSNYYKNGGSGYVTASDTVPNVPVSGQISLANFRGAAANYYHANGNNVSGSCQSTGIACSATTGVCTVTVTGGSGNFSYSWAFVSGISATVNSPSSASTTFTRNSSNNDPATVRSAIYRCTVHDNVTLQNTTVDVTVTTSHLKIV